MKTQPAPYRLRTWKDYNASLVRRGSLTLWIDDAIAHWWLCPERSGKPGASRAYRDRAIEVCLSLRVLFRLALRPVMGFVRSLFEWTGVSLPVPDSTRLCRRAQNLPVRLPVRPSERERHVVIDSTGLKAGTHLRWVGEGKRRVWRKLHVAVDEATGEVLAVEMTDADAADGPLLPGLVQTSEQSGGRIGQASGEGAYDSWANDPFLTCRGIEATIPPRKGSKIRQHRHCSAPPLQRDESLGAIRKKGRSTWAKESGYTRRCLAETHMMRQKRIWGESLSSRCRDNQGTECRLRCAVPGTLWVRLTPLGMPQSYCV